MRISVLTSDRDSFPETQVVSWEELKSALSECVEVVCDKTTLFGNANDGTLEKVPTDRCPSLTRHPTTGVKAPNKCAARKVEAWSPAVFDGKGRAVVNVVGMDCLVFDVDHATLAELTAIDAAIEREGYRAILHSSHSHDPDRNDYCVRIVFECARPLSPGEIVPTRNALQQKLGFRADEQTKDANRIYYIPTRPQGGPAFMFAAQEGKPVEPSQFETPLVLAAPTEVSPPPPSGALSEPVEMDPLRRRIRATGKKPELKDLMSKVLKGEPLAKSGNRDKALQLVCGHLAWELSEQPLEICLEIIRPSIMAMDPPETGSWLPIALDKLKRSRQRFEDMVSSKKLAASLASRLLSRESAASAPDEDNPENIEIFDNDKIKEWCNEYGCGEDTERFFHQWIIRYHGANWIFVNGRYASAVPDEDLLPSLQRDFARAPFTIKETDPKGNTFTMPLRKILENHATTARNVQASLSLQKSFYDSSEETYHEAVCPIRRSLRPEHHPEILHWLELFGGDALLDWVTAVPMLDRPSAAMYIDGPAGTGKNVLADGLARLWHKGGATDVNNVIGSAFNDSLTRCPLIFADEGIPKTDTVLDDLRRLTGAGTRDLNRKFMKTVSIEGNPRLLITANNDRSLTDTGAVLSADDIEAVAQRIRIVKAGNSPVQYLANIRETRGEAYIKREWIQADRIAKTALWLRDNRKIDLGGRFLGSSRDPALSEKIATGTRPVAAVLEFLARYLSDPTKTQGPRIKFGDGRLLVNTELLSDKNTWERYVPSRKIPSAQEVSKNLRTVSYPDAVEVDGHQYHNVKVHMLLNWARTEQVGSARVIQERIERDGNNAAAV